MPCLCVVGQRKRRQRTHRSLARSLIIDISQGGQHTYAEYMGLMGRQPPGPPGAYGLPPGMG